MLKAAAMLAALAVVLSALSCRRPLMKMDAGSDVGGPVDDARPRDLPVVDAPADVAPADVAPADVAPADVAPGDVPAGDVATDVSVERAGDVASDAVDGGAAMCPAGVAPLDVCGCGCCGDGQAMGRACYYASRGETRESVPNPIPPPPNCATAGCSFGVRHLCCADPGPRSGADLVCGIDSSDEDFPRFRITRRIGDVCTTLEMSIQFSPSLPIVGPPGRTNSRAWRGPCDGSSPRINAIGGLGQVTPATSGTLTSPRYDVHVVLFFDSGSGIAEAVRIDRDDVDVGSLCTTDACQTCVGTCAFDQIYRYGYEASRPVAFAHEVILTPPAAFQHIRRPQLTMPPDMGCAPAIPACGADALDVTDVMAAIADPDVQQGLEESSAAGVPRPYGFDPRQFDGQIFRFARDVGGSILVGAPCPAGSTPSSCGAIPPGVDRLVSVLTAFDKQQLADPSCASIRP